jgi:hypothetical protein
MSDEFDFEKWRKRFPDHWDERGWPAFKSTWRATMHPEMRVRVIRQAAPDAQVTDEDELFPDEVLALVFWEGALDRLRQLFTYENTERWNIDKRGCVYGAAGIDRHGRWRSEGPVLAVGFERSMFGGPDTWHYGREPFDNLPFFEPISDWEYEGEDEAPPDDADEPDGA